MPIIILEGIDGAGKSTLAQKLIAASPIPARYEHRGPMTGTVHEEYIWPLLEVKSNELLITDRWHVGETIYGPIYRGQSIVAGSYQRLIEGLLQDLNAVRVIMAPPLTTIRQRLKERGEDYLQPEHIVQVYDDYQDYARDWGYEILTVTDDRTVQHLLGKALGGLNVAA